MVTTVGHGSNRHSLLPGDSSEFGRQQYRALHIITNRSLLSVNNQVVSCRQARPGFSAPRGLAQLSSTQLSHSCRRQHTGLCSAICDASQAAPCERARREITPTAAANRPFSRKVPKPTATYERHWPPLAGAGWQAPGDDLPCRAAPAMRLADGRAPARRHPVRVKGEILCCSRSVLYP